MYLKINIAKTRLFGKHGFYSHIATYAMIRELEKIKPDIIHLHNIHGHYLNVKLLFDYIKKNNLKTVWTLHDCWSMTGHCSHFDYAECKKWETGCHHCPQLREYPQSLIFDRSKECYADKKRIFTGVKELTVVTPSDWLGKLVKKSYLSGYKTVTVNTGIDLDLFSPMKSEIKKELGIEDKKMILAVSMGFGERKGFDSYLKLSKMLDDRYHIVMVGVSQEQISFLPKNITGIQKTQNTEELVKLYTASDVFVNMTLEDTFPTVNIESLACGTPVVTWEVGGSPEACDEDTGITVKRHDVSEIYEAVKRITDSEKPSIACVNRARRCFDRKTMVEKYLQIYDE